MSGEAQRSGAGAAKDGALEKARSADIIGLAGYKLGWRVRSKSEILIAEILDDMSIPFLYEKPLRLDASIAHPIFALLNIRERRVFFDHVDFEIVEGGSPQHPAS